MNAEDVSVIEMHLKLKLPSKYRETLLAGYFVDPYFLQDPEELLIENLELRMCHVKDAFAGGSWPDSYFCIGNDGCGDHYAIDVNDDACAVHFFDHQTGDFTVESGSLAPYIKHVRDLVTNTALRRPVKKISIVRRRVSIGQLEAIIARTDKPRKSVLDPISLSEWRDFVKAQKDMNLQEYRAMMNPATQEEIRVDCPGMAMLNSESPPARFSYSFGRITVRNPGPIAMEKLQIAAATMRANLLFADFG